jgi:prephenate dehydrogenase
MTRVAQLNADMWAKLCIDNNDFLVRELDGFIQAVTLYRDALAEENKVKLTKLLEEGNRMKGELDGQ